MKMMCVTIRSVFLIFIGVVCCACPEPVPTDEFIRSVVTSYRWCDDLKLESSGYDLTIKPVYQHQIGLGIDGRYYSYSYDDTGEYLQKYESLCEKHNDMTYNRISSGAICSAYDFLSLEVSSSEEWDATHPAGTSLGNVVRFRGRSIWPYISGGYKARDWWTKIEKLVSELQPEDLMMLSSSMFGTLTFVQPPAEPGVYPVTVKLTTDEGEVFEASADVEFR